MSGLGVRFAEHLRAAGWLDGAAGAAIGVSGGMDSMVLLHLVRFRGETPGPPVHAAHVDHRMRAGSADDAAWVAGICADWEVPCRVHTAAEPVTSEEAGREMRYRFFEEVRQGLGASAVSMTAHTADDQAETVLFRAARGSGIRGLAGIRPARSPSVVRPLLPFRRREIEAYAAAHGVPYREDPTNRDPRWTRNRLRHEVLPALEEAVPGATGALAALADTSRGQDAALAELVDERIDALATAKDDGLWLDRDGLRRLSDPVLALVVRRAVARMGGAAGRSATAALVRFVREAASGRALDAGGGVVLERQLDAVRVRRPERSRPPGAAPAAVRIDAAGSGDAVFAPDGGGGAVRVAWGPSPRRAFPHAAFIPRDGAAFPLVLRAWQPGDRVHMPYGRKKVKKLLLEARVPAHRRRHFPVLTDASGAILWVPAVTDPAPGGTPPDTPACCVEVSFDHDT